MKRIPVSAKLSFSSGWYSFPNGIAHMNSAIKTAAAVAICFMVLILIEITGSEYSSPSSLPSSKEEFFDEARCGTGFGAENSSVVPFVVFV